jgi:hypothetical protein
LVNKPFKSLITVTGFRLVHKHCTFASPSALKLTSLLHFSGFHPLFSLERQTWEVVSISLSIYFGLKDPKIGLFRIGISP